MNKKLKTLLLVFCALALFASGIFATMAWFNSQDTVVNTFEIGNVEITMDETDVDIYGVATGNPRDKDNAYLVIPGHQYTKDPIIYVTDESQPAYLFVRIDNPLASFEAADTIHTQMTNKGWKLIEDGEHAGLYVKVKDDKTTYDVIDAREGEVQVPVFDYIKIDGKWNYESFSAFHTTPAKINVTAFAIQQDMVSEDLALQQAIATLYPVAP